MYNRAAVDDFVSFIQHRDGIANKSALIAAVQEKYHLRKDGSVFEGEHFAVRFCSSKSTGNNFSNTVSALSKLQKYDKIPFIVCVVTPDKNHLVIANTTFLKKISQTSQSLRVDNIRGSFNFSDIMRNFGNIRNDPAHFEFLFSSHENYTFDENLERLVSATNSIQPTGKRFMPNAVQTDCIKESVQRAIAFLSSNEYHILDNDLQNRVNAVASEIAIAAFIDNINLRGRIIECLITSPDDLSKTLIDSLHTGHPLPEIYTADKLGDYEREFDNYDTATDIKTKILFLSSNPKGYNIDKLLSFLANDRSVYLIYVVAIDKDKKISTKLCSMYNRQLLSGTRIMKQWAGRNSRGVTQYDGTSLESIVSHFDCSIDSMAATEFIERCLNE